MMMYSAAVDAARSRAQRALGAVRAQPDDERQNGQAARNAFQDVIKAREAEMKSTPSHRRCH